MSVSRDFTLVYSGIRDKSLVISQNEEAYNFITDELDMLTLSDGSAPVDNCRLTKFAELAENAHLVCDFN
tara:strand:- start:1450 stop:1659 length:210 start_codon:yes stop_codon:yes gene_type:complete